MIKDSVFRRDLFEIQNSKNLTRDELINTFIPTFTFYRLLSPKNQIILGSRGSGKTALVRMLSHSYLSRLDDATAKNAVDSKSFFGIYIPTDVPWVGALKNKSWLNDGESEQYFQWRLNISTCAAFLETLESCLVYYITDPLERINKEKEIISSISKSWHCNPEHPTVNYLKKLLRDIDNSKEYSIQTERVGIQISTKEKGIGRYFQAELFRPLKDAIRITSELMDFPEDASWILCIDEVEFLLTEHHRILNTFMRTDSGNIVYKITTMPYHHFTRETNTKVTLNEGDDFEYVYIDQSPIYSSTFCHEDINKFAINLYQKRAQIFPEKYKTLCDPLSLLGDSILLDQKDIDVSENSEFTKLLFLYADKTTIKRACRLLSDNDVSIFKDQVARKIYGALLLKHAIKQRKGRQHLDVYSGLTMAIRCSDGNPRRLIRIFSKFLKKALSKKSYNKQDEYKAITPKEQNTILREYGINIISSIQSEPEIGPELHQLIRLIGTYMNLRFHRNKISTDQVSSITLDGNSSDMDWRIVKLAVAYGLLYPNLNYSNPDHMPSSQGTFRLAYVLSPYYEILPRRGKPVHINVIRQDLLKVNKCIHPKSNRIKNEYEKHTQFSLFKKNNGDTI
jgi:Cdc6-like AAA superfamily ATPase